MGKDGQPLNHVEQSIFMGYMDELDTRPDPIDGWDATPRPNPLADVIRDTRHDDARRFIPQGHIALQGDFDQK